MKELRHTEEQNGIRADSLKESQRQGIFVDEFGQANPHVGTGTCRPATKGKLAEPLRREMTMDFIRSLNMTTAISKVFQDLEKRYGKAIALQLLNDDFADMVKEELGMEMDLRVQQIHEWFGE